jgi:hypothetical protein
MPIAGRKERVALFGHLCYQASAMNNRVEHHCQSLTKYQPGACVYLSDHASVTTAAFFVHGFLGDPYDTWMNFHWMIDTHSQEFAEWQTTDAYFLNYSSFTMSIDDASEALLAFVKQFSNGVPDELLRVDAAFPEIPGLLPPPQEVLPPRGYRNIVLIGHSEGAVLIRRAIVINFKRFADTASNLSNASLFLFAPAILGFTPSGFLGSGLSISQFRRMINPFLHFSPAYVELKTGNSLAVLRSDTETLQDEHPHCRCFRADVLFGSNEHVVARGEFLRDRPHVPVQGKNHMNVCKPTEDYREPIAFATVARD